jgi:hypothetical protein
MTREGGCEWYQSTWAFPSSTCPPILSFLKNPGLINSKKLLERLNNSSCKLIESRCQRSKKHKSVWFSIQILSITGGCTPLSSSMPEGLYKNRIKKKNLSGVGRYRESPYQDLQYSGENFYPSGEKPVGTHRCNC